MSEHSTTNDGFIHIGRDDIGQLVRTPGATYIWYLTDCCNASAKGTESGACCRSCYQLIDPGLGMAWSKDEYLKFHNTCPDCSSPFKECTNSPIYDIPEER